MLKKQTKTKGGIKQIKNDHIKNTVMLQRIKCQLMVAGCHRNSTGFLAWKFLRSLAGAKIVMVRASDGKI